MLRIGIGQYAAIDALQCLDELTLLQKRQGKERIQRGALVAVALEELLPLAMQQLQRLRIGVEHQFKFVTRILQLAVRLVLLALEKKDGTEIEAMHRDIRLGCRRELVVTLFQGCAVPLLHDLVRVGEWMPTS